MNRPENLKVKVTFYKRGGKFYSNGYAYVNHFLFEDEYRQDIVDTQDSLMDGWQNDEFYVTVTEHDDSTQHFNERLFMPGAFAGFRRKE